MTLGRSKKNLGGNSKIRLLEALSNLVVSVCANFEECAEKPVGGVGFLMKTYFSLRFCSRLPELRYRLEIQNGSNEWGIELKSVQ